MRNKNCAVSCFFCHTPNNISIGTNFYEARAFYECYNCGKLCSVHITQEPLDIKYKGDTQIGEEPK